MILCRGENISRHYSREPIFTGLSFQIDAGDRIGLVGPNGAGKSTLLRVLLGEDPPDSGALHLSAGVVVAMLRQFADFAPEQTLLAEVHSAMSHLEHWHQAMLEAGEKLAVATDDAESRKWGRVYDEHQELLRRHGGWDFRHRVEEVLFGLGFQEIDFSRELRTFSGGQQSRVALAKLLLGSPDLLLMDEPTNHLDIDTTEWLEEYLCRQSIAMVIVSHDRYFLDKTVNKIFELHGGRLTAYSGNYQAYVRQRDERQKVLEREQTKQDETLAHYEDFVAKNKYGQLARMAKSREKMIARIEAERVETLRTITGPTMGFGAASRTGDIVFSARQLTKAYDRTLFEDANFEIERGERVGIIGPNGAGKTTLLRILLGQEPTTAGVVKMGHNVKIGYLDQDLAMLDPAATPLEVVRPPWRVTEKDEPFRGLLARYGIGYELAEKRIATLSGGERTRVALARICAFEINVLVLDEPTNHLDLWACEALERALKEFEGTTLVVSHDRYFINQVIDRLLVVDGGRVKLIPGNYDRYVESRRPATPAPTPAVAPKAKEPTAAPKQAPAKKKRKFPYRKVEAIEADIASHEGQIAELEQSLNQPEVFKDGRRLNETSQQIASLREQLEKLLEHWEEAMELNAG